MEQCECGAELELDCIVFVLLICKMKCQSLADVGEQGLVIMKRILC